MTEDEINNSLPKESPTVEKINEEFKESLKPNTHGDYSGASKSQIKTPEEEEKEATRKKELLRNMIQEEVGKSMIEINAQLQQIPTIINQSIANIIQQSQQPQGIQPQNQSIPAGPDNSQQMPPGAALAALDPSILTGIAQLIQAWKGGGNAAPVNDEFGNMFKQLGINIMQAGVDGIYKNVYDGYQPQPRNTQLMPGQQPQPNQQQGSTTGFK